MTKTSIASFEAYSRLLSDVNALGDRHRGIVLSDYPVDVARLRRVRIHAERIIDAIDAMIAEIEGGPIEDARLRQDAAILADAIAVTMRRHGEAVARAAVAAIHDRPAAVDAEAATRREAKPTDAPPADGVPAAVTPPAVVQEPVQAAVPASTPAAADPVDADPDFGAPAKPSLPQVAASTIEMPTGDLVHDPEDRPGPIRPASTPMPPPAPPSTDAFEEMMNTPLTGGPAFADRRGTRRTTDLTPDEEIAAGTSRPLPRPSERPPTVVVGDEPRTTDIPRPHPPLRRIMPLDMYLTVDRNRPGHPLRPRSGVTMEQAEQCASDNGLIQGPVVIQRPIFLPVIVRDRLLAVAKAASLSTELPLPVWMEATWATWFLRGCPMPRFLGCTFHDETVAVNVRMLDAVHRSIHALADFQNVWMMDVYVAVLLDAVVRDGDEALFGLSMDAPRRRRDGPMPMRGTKGIQTYYRPPPAS